MGGVLPMGSTYAAAAFIELSGGVVKNGWRNLSMKFVLNVQIMIIYRWFV